MLQTGTQTVFGFLGFLSSDSPVKEPEKVKMLTSKGELVEIDAKGLSVLRRLRKASKQDLMNWVE